MIQTIKLFDKSILFPIALSLTLLDFPYWFLNSVWGSFYGGPATLSAVILILLSVVRILSNPTRALNYIKNISYPLVFFVILTTLLSIYHDPFEYNYLSGLFLLLLIFDFLFFKDRLLLDKVVIHCIYFAFTALIVSLIVYFIYRYFPVLLYGDLGYRVSWESSLTSKYSFYVQALVLLTMYRYGLNKLLTLVVLLFSIIFLISFELDGPLVVVFIFIFLLPANNIIRKFKYANYFFVAIFICFMSLFIFKPLFFDLVFPFLQYIESEAVGADHGLWVRLFQSFEAVQFLLNLEGSNFIFGTGVEKAVKIEFYEHGILHSGIFLILLGYGIMGFIFMIYIIFRTLPFHDSLNFISLSTIIFVFSYMILNGLIFALIPFLIMLARASYGEKCDWESS